MEIYQFLQHSSLRHLYVLEEMPWQGRRLLHHQEPAAQLCGHADAPKSVDLVPTVVCAVCIMHVRQCAEGLVAQGWGPCLL